MAFTPASYYITVTRGTDLAVPLGFQDSDGGAVDLTGCTLVAHVRASAASTTLIKDLAPDIDDATAGLVSINLTYTETLAMTAGEYVWDLLIEDADGKRSGPYIAGKFIVQEPVSKFA